MQESTATFTASLPFLTPVFEYLNFAVVSSPPAQPTHISPSSSLSRFMRLRPLTKPFFRAFAPSRPVSSDTVNRASSLPVDSLPLTRARAQAIPMPSSAPSVVSCETIQPSSMVYGTGSLEKSWLLPAFFSQTISEWHWSTRVGTFSLPLLASLIIRTLPASSVRDSRPWEAANALSHAIICSS